MSLHHSDKGGEEEEEEEEEESDGNVKDRGALDAKKGRDCI